MLLSLNRTEFLSLHDAAAKGDVEATASIAAMWHDYQGCGFSPVSFVMNPSRSQQSTS